MIKEKRHSARIRPEPPALQATPLDSQKNLKEGYRGVNGPRHPEIGAGWRIPRGRVMIGQSRDSSSCLRPSHSLIPYFLFSPACRYRSCSRPPHWTEGSLSDQHRHLCDEVSRSQDTFPQLKRPPRQFVERPPDPCGRLDRIRPTEAKRSQQMGGVPEGVRHRRTIQDIMLLCRPLAEHRGKEPSGHVSVPLLRWNAVQTGTEKLVRQTHGGCHPTRPPPISLQ